MDIIETISLKRNEQKHPFQEIKKQLRVANTLNLEA